MNREQAEKLTKWLIAAASKIDHGECSIAVRVRDGHIQQIQKHIMQSELPTDQAAFEQSRNRTRRQKAKKSPLPVRLAAGYPQIDQGVSLDMT